MNRADLQHFDPERTLLGGQSFSWRKFDDQYIGVTQDKAIVLKYEQPFLYWQTYPQKDDFELVNNYLRLDMDIESKLKAVDDKYVTLAIEQFKGLRLLDQDFNETVISFLISQNKNITSIRNSINYLSENYGDSLKVNDLDIKLFPRIERLAELSEKELQHSKVGYRAPYIIEASKRLVSGEFSNIEIETADIALEKLLSLYGVGPKVADCILTFSLKVNDVTPVDTWAKKILKSYYNYEVSNNYSKQRAYFTEKFNDKTALAGHYLFEYARQDPLLQ